MGLRGEAVVCQKALGTYQMSQKSRSNEGGLETTKCGHWDVSGDLSTVHARTEIEKRFQTFCLLMRNQCNPDPACSI